MLVLAVVDVVDDGNDAEPVPTSAVLVALVLLCHEPPTNKTEHKTRKRLDNQTKRDEN